MAKWLWFGKWWRITRRRRRKNEHTNDKNTQCKCRICGSVYGFPSFSPFSPWRTERWYTSIAVAVATVSFVSMAYMHRKFLNCRMAAVCLCLLPKLVANCHWHSTTEHNTTQPYEGYILNPTTEYCDVYYVITVIAVIVYHVLAFCFSLDCFSIQHRCCTVLVFRKFCVLRLSKINSNNNIKHIKGTIFFLFMRRFSYSLCHEFSFWILMMMLLLLTTFICRLFICVFFFFLFSHLI